MISRRENLLIRPWEQRRYENHRKKVLSAVPAIDNREPASRMHVLIKLKKHQKEKEKHERIERDNFTLLRNLSYIMRTNRVDNNWRNPQPNFLNRVTMFDANPKYKFAKTEDLDQLQPRINISRRNKCLACTPQQIDVNDSRIPEERIPWEPQKLPLSRKIRSQSVPLVKKTNVTFESKFDNVVTTQERTKSCKGRIEEQTIKKEEREKRKEKRPSLPAVYTTTAKVTFQRGSLKLSVNIPSDTTVKLHERNTYKTLYGGDCYCRNVTKLKTA